MAATRKIVRQVERPSLGSFDEQLWTINCVLLVLAGFVAGIVIAKSSFEGGPLWQNGWFRLSLVAAALVVLFVGTWWLHRRQHVRRMQLAVLLSLLMNLGIEIWLFSIHMHLPIRPDQAASSEWLDDREELTLPDYGREPTEEMPTEDLQRPVETVAAEVPRQEVDRQETTQPPTPTQRSTTAEPSATASQPAPSTLERAQTAVSAPRRTDQPSGSQVSRQQMTAPSTPTEAIPAPQAAASTASEPMPLNANVTPLERSATGEPQLAQRSPAQVTATQVSPAQPQLQRSEAPRTPDAPASPAASVARQTPQLPQQQPLAADSAAPAAPAEAAPAAQVAPSAAQVARQQAAAPATQQSASAPQAAAATQPAAANIARSQSTQDTPQTSQPAPAAVARAAGTAGAANVAAQPIEAPGAQAAGGAVAASQLAASSNAAAVTRAAAAAPSSSGGASASAASAPAQQVGPAQLSRAAQAAPSGMSAAPRPGQLGRTAASRTASTAASAAAEVPSATVAEAGGTPAPSANAQATTQSRTSGSVPLPRGIGPAQPAPGEALNTARGLAQAAPRRVETSADSSQASNTPGAGQVARSQGVGSSSAPSTAVPLEAPTAAAGSLSQQPSTAPQQALTGVARGTGQAPVAAPAALSAAEAGSGATVGAPSSAAMSRASTATAASSPQVGQGAGTLGRTASAAAGAGSAMAAEPAAVGVTSATGSAGSLEAAAGQVARQATSVASGNGPATSGVAAAAPTGAGVIAGTGPTRAATSAAPTSSGVGPAGSVARSTSTSGIDGQAESAAATAAVAPGSTATASPGTVVSANVAGQSRQAAGLPGGLLNRGDAGGEASGVIGASAGATAARRAEAGVEAGPQLPGAMAMPAGRQNTSGALPAGLAEADEPGPVAGVAGDPTSLAGQGPAGEVTRQASGALPVQVAALSGPGSLIDMASPQPGLPNRLARPDAESIHRVAQRFLLDRTSGVPGTNSQAFGQPAEAYLQRTAGQRPDTVRSRGGSLGSERSVEMGLDYLAKQQLADGRWSLQNVATGATAVDAAAGAGQMQADTAGTGLALLCFLGAGYTHADGKYRDTVAAGVAHLVGNQKPDGDLFAGGSKYVWFYSHGIAAISLCEAYGMTKDPALREPAQKALDFILAAQHPTFGGWRYAPQSSTDTSVSGWQVMALKSGELAGLSVPADAYAKVGRWLDGAQTLGGAQYSYRPEAQIPHQRNPSLAMTAEGLLMRLYTGWDRTSPQVVAGVEHLRQNLPSIGTRAQPLRDSYYWYYATQVMFQAQGDAWNSWNERLRNLLVNSQAQSGPLTGSWDPRGAVPDRWGLEGGRLYVTAMHLLMLEVYYRNLPLYKLDE